MKRSLTFDDDALRAAVATFSTWPDVGEALFGTRRLGAHTRERIKRRASELHLDISALQAGRPGPRPGWDDDALVAAVSAARSWAEAGRMLGTTGATRLKPHAERLGIDTGHLDDADHMRPPDAAPVSPGAVQPEALRVAAESLAAAWYTLRNGAVFQPPSNASRIDLLVQRGDEMVRVQVKSATHRTGGGWALRPVCFQGEGRSVARPFREGEVDELFAVTGDGRMFLLPEAVFVGRRTLTLGAKYEKYEVRMF